jgi:hypothetical protein
VHLHHLVQAELTEERRHDDALLDVSLARLELRALLEAMLDRYERIEIARPVERVRSNLLNGYEHLPVRLR